MVDFLRTRYNYAIHGLYKPTFTSLGPILPKKTQKGDPSDDPIAELADPPSLAAVVGAAGQRPPAVDWRHSWTPQELDVLMLFFFSELRISCWRFSLNDFMVLICINELCPAQVIRLWSFLDLLDVAQWPPWHPHSSGSSQWEKKAHHLTDKKYPAWSTFTSRTGKIHHVSWEDSRTKW